MKRVLTVVLAGLVISLWGAWFTAPWWMHSFGVNWNLTEVGPWGDSFGVINTLFSGLGFVAVVRTLMIQSEQIASQQTEIEKQQERLDEADAEAKVIQFERIFFQLLELFREARDQVSYKDSAGNAREGRSAFELAEKLLMGKLRADFLYPDAGSDKAYRISHEYVMHIHVGAGQTFGPYYRLLYTILRRISEEKALDEKQKARYGNLVRSQLSNGELVCITANGFTQDSNNLMKYLVEFRIPKYLPIGAYRDWITEAYPPKSLEPRD